MAGFYRIPQELIEDIAFYRSEVEKFLRGEIPPERFKPFRVSRGIYGQRDRVTYMVRIRVPAGGVTPEQMERISDLSEKYGNGIPHITTRQDIQIHGVRIEHTPDVMEGLTEVGLATKGGGGNTVRNITACPDAGICDKEAFDVAPYAIALTEHLIKDPRSYNLPRKFKIAFSGCSEDCAFSTVNDIGLIAKTRYIDGNIKRGFRLYAAGGMGNRSRIATLLEDFISDEDIVYAVEAIVRIFDRYGDRRNKHRARLRFVIERFGEEEFKRIYLEELEAVRKEGEKRLTPREIPLLRNPVERSLDELPDDPDFREWMDRCVKRQKQDGYFYVIVPVPIGNMSAEKFRMLSRIVRNFGEGSIRTTQDQNIVLRWVHRGELYELWNEMKRYGFTTTRGIWRVISCPGAATCNLGICNSRALASAILDRLNGNGLMPSEKIGIRISGCPNVCGQHLIGSIGLQGGAKHIGSKLLPYYAVMIGGKVKEGETRFGEKYGIVPSRKVPLFIEELLKLCIHEGNSDIHSFISNGGTKKIKELIKKYAPPETEVGDRVLLLDWGSDEEFSLAGMGPGECGAGVFEMIESDLAEAGKALERAKTREKRDYWIYQSMVSSSRALLITQGLEPKTDEEVFKSFIERFVKKGIVSGKFMDLYDRAVKLKMSPLKDEEWEKELDYAQSLLADVSEAYKGMDSSLKFPIKEAPQEIKEEEKQVQFMDLRGVECPLNYVRVRLKLEEMGIGEVLTVLLDDGEPIRNVPVSLQRDGQEVLGIERVGEYFKVIVKKAVD